MYKVWPFTSWGLGIKSINIPSTIQKRLLKFLLKRALGQFLAEELDLDNLEVQLGEGLLQLKELQLNVEVLNDLVTDLPVVITDGKIGGIIAKIPWKNIWKSDFVLELHNLQITVVPEYAKPRNAKSTPEDSHILSSSFHFAGDFLRHEIPPEEDEELRNSIYHSFHNNALPSESQELGSSGLEQSETLPQQSTIIGDNGGIEGIQILARLIDKLMSNVKIILKNTCIRLSHQSTISPSGDDGISNNSDQLKDYYFDLEIPIISFKDEKSGFDDESVSPNSTGSANVTLPPAQPETVKSFSITGLNIWLREAANKAVNHWVQQQSPPSFSGEDPEDSGDEFFDSCQGTSSENDDDQDQINPYEAMIFSCAEQENLIKVTLRQNAPPVIQFDSQNAAASYLYTQEAMQQANSTQTCEIQGAIQSLIAVLTPSQASLIADLVDALSKSKSAGDIRSSSSTESDDEIQDTPRLHSHRNSDRIPESSVDSIFNDLGQDVTYSSVPSPIQNNDMDDLLYNLTSPTSNTPGSIPTVAPSMKIEFTIHNIEMFFLYSDPLPNFIPEKKFFDTRLPENLNISHIKIDVNELSCEIQKWDPETLIGSLKRVGSVPNIKSLDTEESSRILIDITFADFSISEWLKNDDPEIEKLKTEVTLPNFNTYDPLLFFDLELLNSYRPEESEFPNFPVKNVDHYGFNRNTGTKKAGRTTSRFNRSNNNIFKDVIRLKINITNVSNEGNLSSAANTVNYEVAVDLEPVQLHLDLRIIDRLENYLVVFSGDSRNSISREEKSAKHKFNDHSTSQNIIDDLDTQRLNEKNLEKSQLRINCDLIRFILHCPDLSAANTHKIVENYCIHSNLIIIDIININIATGSTKQPCVSRTESYGIQQHSESEGHSNDLQQNRMRIEFGGINIFLKETNDSNAKCFLTGMPLLTSHSTHLRSMTHISPMYPNFEITYRPPRAIKNKLSFIGSNIRSSPFSQTFTSFEGEDRSNWPAENEEEEILIFKQRTIESSLFVINCSFPLTRVRVTKSSFDVLQILLNDLVLWQPKNSGAANEQDNHVNLAGSYDYRPYQPVYGMDSYDSENHMRTEGSFMGSRMDMSIPSRPSLASIVVFMTKIEVVILCDPEKQSDNHAESGRTYQLNMSDFRFFTVVKHEGKNDTYVVLDNEYLDYLDITTKDKTQILCRTLNKGLKAKNTRPMMSLIMLISLDVVVNMKEVNLTLSINGITLRLSQDTRWIDDLVAFLQEPEMKTFIELPSQFTKLSVTINDSSLDFNPNNIPGRIILVLDSLKASSNIISESPMFNTKLIGQNLDLMLVGDKKSIDERAINRLGSSIIDVKKYWQTMGFVKAASLDFVEIQLHSTKADIYPKFELDITNENLTIEICADTFQTILNMINHLTPKGEVPEKGRKAPHVTTDPIVQNMLENLDEHAFDSKAKSRATPAMIDDIKISKMSNRNSVTNLEFIEEYYAIEGNESDELDTHTFEHPVMYDDNEGILIEQPLFAASSTNEINEDLVDLENSEEDNRRDDKVKRLDSPTIEFVDDHFSIPNANEPENSYIQELPKSLTRIRLRDFNLVCKLHDGYDWERSRKEALDSLKRANSQAKNVNVVETGTASGSSIGDNPSLEENNIYSHNYNAQFRNSDYDLTSEVDYTDDYSDTASQVSSRLDPDNTNIREGKRPEHSSRRSRPKLSRSSSSKIDIKLEKVNLEFDVFPDDNLLAFRLLLLVRDIEILDNIKTSAWNKFLSHMRPDNNTSPQLRIKARFLPLRFYIDQDALQFLIRFLSFQDSTIEKPPQVEDDTYFQSFEIHPLKMKVDYKPKHIDYTNLKEGNLVELMNLFHFEAAEMTLSNVKLTGVKGCQRLFEELGAAWLPHIKSTQVPNVVSGVAPIRSLVNLGSGVADLILLPIEQYKKDGRIIRGIQKGTESFARATTMEAIRFGTKLAVGTQIMLEHADEILSFESQTGNNTRGSINTTVSSIDEEFDSEEENIKELISKYADQPADLNEGIEAAYKSLRANIGTAAHTIFAVPMEVYEKTGTQGTVKAVIRAVPVAVLKPMIGASEAVSKTLLGLRNTIDPNKKLQMEDKYKKR
ncbi:9475_t:CDS:10 [Funneliformis geosporum]|uniref:Autophagy-related protein 2 n=1 Tax=Funneliformis geosporum TaxID=1117311 RepID=A0A9W4WW17_9GLOM|nr:13157_t:CDS:10 [Funneliformis geosporum]CAI2168237.1 9475_t:CDS:10 [Funneliformis geosporum]